MTTILTRRALIGGATTFGLTGALHAQAVQPGSTPQDHGAKGDGLSDDSPALQRWLDHLIGHAKTGYVPSGDYLMRRGVSHRIKGIARFGIIGAGSPMTRFVIASDNSEGGFEIDGFHARAHQAVFSGFSLVVKGSSAVGLRLRLPEGGAQHQRSVTLSDVWARSANKTSDHFLTAFDLTGCWRPRLQDCGWDGPYVGVDDAEDSARFFCRTGFDLDGCYGLSVEDCYAWGCATGISARQFVGLITGAAPSGQGTRFTLNNGPVPYSKGASVTISQSRGYDGSHIVTGTGRDSFEVATPYAADSTGVSSLTLGPEGMNFKDNTINGVKTGIWVERLAGREPTCWINGNHINYRDAGVILDGVKIIQMDQNNTYNEDMDETFPAAPVDIDLRNASEYILSGHVFHFDGHPRRIGIRVESDTPGEGDNGLIHHSIFSGRFATAVHLTRGVTGVRVGPNLFPGKIARRVRDENGGNVIL